MLYSAFSFLNIFLTEPFPIFNCVQNAISNFDKQIIPCQKVRNHFFMNTYNQTRYSISKNNFKKDAENEIIELKKQINVKEVNENLQKFCDKIEFLKK